jgi:hypothetical protein
MLGRLAGRRESSAEATGNVTDNDSRSIPTTDIARPNHSPEAVNSDRELHLDPLKCIRSLCVLFRVDHFGVMHQIPSP